MYGISPAYTLARQRMIDNYELVEGTFDKSQFEYIYNRYGLSTPTLFADYPDLENKIDNIIGKFLKRPMPYTVSVINEKAVSKKNDKLVKLKLEALLAPIHQEIEQMQGIALPQEEMGQELPTDIQKINDLTFREALEEVYNIILQFNIEDQKMILKFKDALRDLIICNLMIGEVSVRDIAGKRHPYFEKYDPRCVIFDMQLGVEYISDSEWVFTDNLYSVSELLEMFRFELTEEQKEDLSNYQGILGGTSIWQPLNGDWYRSDDLYNTKIRVVRGKWLAKVKRIVKLSDNKYDPSNPFIKIMPDGFKIPKGSKKGEYVEQWCSECWKGALIGGTMLVGVKVDEYQARREAWGYANTKTGFICIRKKGVSKIGSIANIHHFKNFVMYYIGQVMARPGQAIEYDLAYKPKDMSIQQVMADAKEGFIVKDSSQQEMGMPGNGGIGRAMATVNLSMGDTLPMLQNLYEMLNRAEDRILGTSPDSLGFAKPYEKSGVVASNVENSEAGLAPLFQLMNIFRAEVYNRVCDLARYCYKDGDMFWWLGDTGMKTLELSMDICNDEVGIFVKADETDAARQKKLEDMAMMALNAGQVGFEPLVDMVFADTSIEARQTLKKGFEALRILQQNEMKQKALIEQQGQPQIAPQVEVAKINQETAITTKAMDIKAKADAQEIALDIQAVDMAHQQMQQQPPNQQQEGMPTQ